MIAPVDMISLVKITIAANFISRDEWPKTTANWCHWCSHPFRTVPVLVPVWSGTCYHLHGCYCSWNCAKSHTLEKTKAGKFPKDLTSITLFAFQISFKGRHCRCHSACDCYSRFCGIIPAPSKETLKAFGGKATITEFRDGCLTIDSYDWITRSYKPRAKIKETLVKPQYLYTLQPLRRVQLLEEQEEDPIVLIQRRCYR